MQQLQAGFAELATKVAAWRAETTTLSITPGGLIVIKPITHAGSEKRFVQVHPWLSTNELRSYDDDGPARKPIAGGERRI